MKSQAESTAYVFEGFRVDSEKRLLFDSGNTPVPLTGKVFDTLLYLVANPGKVIEKEELMSAIWTDTIVEENNLNKNISTLRRILGESRAEHRFIVTVPGRGYKFVAEVSKIGIENEAATQSAESATGPGGVRLWLLSGAVALLIIASIAIIYSGSSGPDGAKINSVAVLPFLNVGGDPELAYFSEGLSENLIDRLSELPQLAVIARTSSFKYRDENPDIEDIARKLGVHAIVTGRVTRRGDDLNIRVELIDARSNKHLWGQSFDRKVEDALLIETEIARQISSKMNLKISDRETRQLDKRGTQNPQAYELLLKGDFLDRTMSNWPKAIEYYQQAITLDPKYALAHARLAHTYAHLGGNSILDPTDTRPKAQEAANRAVELDPDLAEAHLELANLARDAWNWKTAESEYRLTLQLNPNHSQAHRRLSTFLGVVGRFDEALSEAHRAKELDPQQLGTRISIVNAHMIARRHDDAVRVIKEMIELGADSFGIDALMGNAHLAMGMNREAIENYTESIRRGNKLHYIKISLGAAYAKSQEIKKARDILRELETTKEYVSPAELSILYIALGERDKAFALLDRAYAEHDLQLQYLNADSAFDPLRSDPRFRDLVGRVGLPQ